jgi:hypothetical protein
MTAALAGTIGSINLSWVRLEIGLLVGALMMGA